MKNIVLAASFALATQALAADPPKVAAPAAAAPAATAADQAPPPPAPELGAAMKGMEGKWKCEGKAPDSAFGKAHPIKAEMTSRSDLNGYWYLSRYEEKKTKENPTPYVMESTVGFDPSKKTLVRTDVDGMGLVTHLTSKGWEGDKMAWSGEVMGMKMLFKDTLTKKSDKEVTTTLEMAGPDGKFSLMAELTCKK
ncbi:MAG: DUF1579 family protein [Deltaproteobacteria bacterium]|nr:DUF1579 family protein [Deltaproteobacteria bacterium]